MPPAGSALPSGGRPRGPSWGCRRASAACPCARGRRRFRSPAQALARLPRAAQRRHWTPRPTPPGSGAAGQPGSLAAASRALTCPAGLAGRAAAAAAPSTIRATTRCWGCPRTPMSQPSRRYGEAAAANCQHCAAGAGVAPPPRRRLRQRRPHACLAEALQHACRASTGAAPPGAAAGAPQGGAEAPPRQGRR